VDTPTAEGEQRRQPGTGEERLLHGEAEQLAVQHLEQGGVREQQQPLRDGQLPQT
jgi:hypothetical protein